MFNGDLGTMRGVDPTEQELLLALDNGREIGHPYANVHALAHACAISVHKAQGADGESVRRVGLWIAGLPSAARSGRNLRYANIRAALSSPAYVSRLAVTAERVPAA